MKKKFLFNVIVALFISTTYAQVGINTLTPNATLHVLPTSTGAGTAEGIIAPNLTRAQLISKDARYAANQRGAIVYVTDLSGALTAKTTRVTQIGYYFFDGSIWQQFVNAVPTIPVEPWNVQGGNTQATANNQNIHQIGNVAIGSNTSGAYKFQVTGNSNVTANSRTATSTVTGAETVGGTLGVTGVATMSTHTYVAGNLGVGTTSPSHKVHVVGNDYTTGIAKIGGTNATNASAQLELADNNKGFLPNRVALTSLTVRAPVGGAVDGMMVYNTATVAAQRITPGYYYWRNNRWNRLIDQIPSSLTSRNLVAEVISSGNNANQTANGTLLDFGVVTIPEAGAYAFTFRLYGNITYNNTRPVAGTTVFYYLALMRGATIMDTAELDVVIGTGAVASYSVTLGATFNAGDVVTFRLSHHPTLSNYPWTLPGGRGNGTAARTSMVWWKL